MKAFKFGLIVAAAALITFGLGGTAAAFHSGGVAECVGCHSMHNGVAGALLQASDVSSTCLNCHESTRGSSYHISTAETAMGPGLPPLNRTAGGDFAWLKKDFSWSTGWSTENEDGDHHGHNIIASDYNYTVDGHNDSAPGGSMSAGQLHCTSCHDQHGKLRRLSDGTIANTGAPIIASGSYNNSPVPGEGQAVGVYRLLRGVGSPDDARGGVTFTSAVPAAVTPSSYNRSEAVTDTRTAYGAGMSDFCATCHPDMHVDSGQLVHPVDQNLGSTIAGFYNSYVGSGDLTGDVSTSYDSLVPFQTNNSTDYVALAALAVNDGSVTTGPAGTDRVQCLSCHRAHASGWEFGTRWDVEIEMLVIDGEWPGTDAVSPEAQGAKWAKGRTVAERAKAYNDTLATDYATYQRVLCNKCHAKD